MKLSANDISKEYNGKRVVDNVTLEVNTGEVVGLLGPNGAGKTTTFYMITGIIKPDSGQIICGGVDITGYPIYKRSNMGIGYLAQEPSIFRNLTVEENITAVLEMKKYPMKKILEVSEQLLEEFKITHIKKSLGYVLSGGERRRVEIARTLANEPKFILLDEPFAGVDPVAVEEIQQIIKYLKSRGLGILITDHSVRETLSIIEKAYIMAEGKVIISGTAKEVSDNELVKKIYLGKKFKLNL